MSSPTRTANPADREVPLAPDGEVRISLPAGSLRVRAIDEDVVRLRTRDGQPLDRLLEVEVRPGIVAIAPGPTTVQLGGLRIGRGGSADLEVEVPRRAAVVARTASADIEGEGCAGQTDWTTASGTVRLRVAGRDVGVRTVSGDIDVDADTALELRARSVSGDLRIRAPRLERLELGTTSGDAVVEAALGPGPHELETLSGDVRLVTGSPVRVETRTVTGDVLGDVEHRTEGGGDSGMPRILVVGDGSVPVRWRSMSGDLRLVAGPSDEVPQAAAGAPSVERAAATWPAAASVVAEGTAAPNLARSREARRRTEQQEEARLAVLRGVERGELTIDEASRRLEALDEPGALAGTGWV